MYPFGATKINGLKRERVNFPNKHNFSGGKKPNKTDKLVPYLQRELGKATELYA